MTAEIPIVGSARVFLAENAVYWPTTHRPIGSDVAYRKAIVDMIRLVLTIGGPPGIVAPVLIVVSCLALIDHEIALETAGEDIIAGDDRFSSSRCYESAVAVLQRAVDAVGAPS